MNVDVIPLKELMETPHWTEQLQNILTSAAILTGGAWALWKWKQQAEINRRRDIPALDGKLTCNLLPVSANQCILDFSMVWRNVGPEPVNLKCHRTTVELYELQIDGTESGDLSNDAKTKVDETNPNENNSRYILEPKTESQMQAQFIVKRGKLYYVEWKIEQERDDNKAAGHWFRNLIVNAPEIAE